MNKNDLVNALRLLAYECDKKYFFVRDTQSVGAAADSAKRTRMDILADLGCVLSNAADKLQQLSNDK